MSRFKDFLSLTTNVTQTILTPSTRQRLVDEEIIQERSNEGGFDKLTLLGNTTLPITFSDCRFEKVPYQLDSRAFLEYLGIKHTVSNDMLLKIFQKNDSIVDGEVIYEYLKTHVKESLDANGEIWQNKFGEKVLPVQIPLPIIIDWLGFDGTFNADFFRLKLMVFHDPSLIHDYQIEEQTANALCNHNGIDFILATLLRRLENLKSFENAAIVYLDRISFD